MAAAYDAASNSASSDSVISVKAGGQLACEQVYYLPWKPGTDKTSNRASLQKFVADAVTRAARDRYDSIAFPAVGCGKLGQPATYVAQTMTAEAKSQSAQHGISVVFVIQSDRADIYDAFHAQIHSADSPVSHSLAVDSPTTVPTKNVVSMKVGNGVMEVVQGDITTQSVCVSGLVKGLTDIRISCLGRRPYLQYHSRQSEQNNLQRSGKRSSDCVRN